MSQLRKRLFKAIRPGVHTNGEWVIAKLRRGWQLYGCDVATFDGHVGYKYALGHSWPSLRDAKDHATYRLYWA